MKNILLASFIVFFNFGYSQKVDTLLITPSNVNGYLVKEFEGKSTEDIYLALKKWTQYNIHKADTAINSDIENEYLSFSINGVGDIRYKNKNNWLWKLNLYVEARIKGNRLRLDIIVNEIDGVSSSELDDIPIVAQGGINGMNALFKKDGSPKKATKTYRDDVNISLNEFANYLFNSIDGNLDYKKEDW